MQRSMYVGLYSQVYTVVAEYILAVLSFSFLVDVVQKAFFFLRVCNVIFVLVNNSNCKHV